MKSASGGSIVNGIAASPDSTEPGMFGEEEHVDSGWLVFFSETCPKQISGNRIEIKNIRAVFLPESNINMG